MNSAFFYGESSFMSYAANLVGASSCHHARFGIGTLKVGVSVLTVSTTVYDHTAQQQSTQVPPANAPTTIAQPGSSPTNSAAPITSTSSSLPPIISLVDPLPSPPNTASQAYTTTIGLGTTSVTATIILSSAVVLVDGSTFTSGQVIGTVRESIISVGEPGSEGAGTASNFGIGVIIASIFSAQPAPPSSAAQSVLVTSTSIIGGMTSVQGGHTTTIDGGTTVIRGNTSIFGGSTTVITSTPSFVAASEGLTLKSANWWIVAAAALFCRSSIL